jgi:hypothetical protein
MRILFMLLFFFSSPAMADWEKIFLHDDTTVYLDFSYAQSTSNSVTIRELRDCNKEQSYMGSMYGYTFLSSAMETEYQCQTRQMRHLHAYWFAGNMGQGKKNFSKNHPGDWISLDEDDIAQRIFTVVCPQN